MSLLINHLLINDSYYSTNMINITYLDHPYIVPLVIEGTYPEL